MDDDRVTGLIRDVAGLCARVEMQDRQISEMRLDVRQLLDMANKGRGGLIVMLMLGGALGSVLPAILKRMGFTP